MSMKKKKGYFGLFWHVAIVAAVAVIIGLGALSVQAYALPAVMSDTSWYYTNKNPYYPSDQCVWYAWGRASEILGSPLSSGSLGNGGDFWRNVPSTFERGQTPREGAIACGGGNTQYGHVAIVESVNSNGTITFSEVWGSQHDGGKVHWVTYSSGAAWASGSGGGSNFQGYIYLTGGATNRDPIFDLNDISVGNHTVYVRGWAYDPDTPSQSIAVHIYIGDEKHTFYADAARPDVNNAFGIAGNHGFDITIPTLKSGEQNITLYAINTVDGNNPPIASTTLSIGTCLDTPDGGVQLPTDVEYSIRPVLAPQMAVMAKSGSTSSGVTFELQPWSNSLNQTYGISRYSTGNAYRNVLTANHSSMVFDLDCSKTDFGRLIQSTRNDGYNQMWYVVQVAENQYKIVSVLTGWCVELPNFATSAGTTINMCPDNGSNAQKFYLVPLDISKATIDVASNVSFDGTEKEPAVIVMSAGVTLVENLDYRVTYSNNMNPGVASVLVEGIGEFAGTSKTATFTIRDYSIEGAIISSIPEQTFTGSAITPMPTVTLNGAALVEGTDYMVVYSNNTNVGTATITVAGKGNYTGTASATFVISAASISNATVAAPDQVYTGSALTPASTVTLNGKTLVEGIDYTIAYSNNTNVGTAIITVEGKGNYTGSATGTFIINDVPKTDINAASVFVPNQTYTGSPLLPVPTVTLSGKTLVSGTDYMVAYSNNTSVGTATIIVTGKGDYTGTATGTFIISSASISEALVTASGQTYTGSALTPLSTVILNGKTLISGTDYTVSYSNNTNAGTAIITVTGMGNYTGIATGTFTIAAVNVSSASVSASNQTYTGSALAPVATVNLGSKTLVESTDYRVIYSNNTNVGTAIITIIGRGNYTGTATGAFVISAASVSSAKVSASNQIYNGSALTPTPTVTLNGKTLVEGTDYTVAYSNNTNVGTAIITVTGKGNYTDNAIGTFEITLPPTTSISDATVAAIPDQTYTGSAIRPAVAVSIGSKVLIEGTDFAVSYSNNVAIGTATVTIIGVGNYSGTKTVNFDITAINIASATVSSIPDQTYTGSAIRPELVVKLGSRILFEGTDYTVAYSNNIAVGTATVTVTGKGNYTGSVVTTFQIVSGHALGWAQEGGNWYYYDSNGQKMCDHWEQYNKAWYYFGADGKLVWNGWSYYEGVHYYMGKNGQLAKNTWAVIDGAYYYIGSNYQPVISNWVKYNNSYFYMDANGNPIVNKWEQIGGTWYHFKSNGVCDQIWNG